jgi:hypothetical protein
LLCWFQLGMTKPRASWQVLASSVGQAGRLTGCIEARVTSYPHDKSRTGLEFTNKDISLKPGERAF